MDKIYLGLVFQFSEFLCQAQQDTANVMDGWLQAGVLRIKNSCWFDQP